MKPKIVLLLSLAAALISLAVSAGTGAITIYWYSQAPNVGTLHGNDIFLIERPVPHTNMYASILQLQNYLGGGSGGIFAPTITSFGNNIGSVEIGATVNSTTLSWTLGGGAPTAQSINQGVGPVPVGTLSKVDGTSYSTTRTYTLSVSNPNGSAAANTTVSFLNKRYWGASSQTALDDAQINALSGELATSYAGFSHPVTTVNEYLYFAFPAAWGTPIVYLPIGLQNTDFTITVTNHVNASLNTTSYKVYRSNNLLNGTWVFLTQ